MSYAEWIQNLQNMSWDAAQVDGELSRRLTGAFDATLARARADACTLRQAAYRVAVARVARAETLRGLEGGGPGLRAAPAG